jgi:hypothetical protein
MLVFLFEFLSSEGESWSSAATFIVAVVKHAPGNQKIPKLNYIPRSPDPDSYRDPARVLFRNQLLPQLQMIRITSELLGCGNGVW